MVNSIFTELKNGLIVSCQAYENEPLHGSIYMAKMALAAEIGGAKGIRANGYDDIKAIKEETNLPVVGINKKYLADGSIFITPDLKSAEEIVKAGADIVAIDCTIRNFKFVKPGYENLKEIKREFNILTMADISNIKEAINAYEYGADIISTTMSGYTPDSPKLIGPDFELIASIKEKLGDKIFINAEGRFSTPEGVLRALKCGADFVTVGTAITRPQYITNKIVSFIRTNIQ